MSDPTPKLTTKYHETTAVWKARIRRQAFEVAAEAVRGLHIKKESAIYHHALVSAEIAIRALAKAEEQAASG